MNYVSTDIIYMTLWYSKNYSWPKSIFLTVFWVIYYLSWLLLATNCWRHLSEARSAGSSCSWFWLTSSTCNLGSSPRAGLRLRSLFPWRLSTSRFCSDRIPSGSSVMALLARNRHWSLDSWRTCNKHLAQFSKKSTDPRLWNTNLYLYIVKNHVFIYFQKVSQKYQS